MNKLSIKLKQHTPLIHFQHDQAGATLRATEVKPKLDKFILRRLGEGDYRKGLEKAKENKWLISNTNALDYKLRFKLSETPRISHINEVKKDKYTGTEKTKQRQDDKRVIKDLNSYPLYFGNLDKDMEDPTEYKKFSFLDNPFDMEILTFQSSLLNVLDQKVDFCSFFAYNNFGSRQSKGFGSFYIDKSDKKYKDPNSKYQFTIDITKPLNWNLLFNRIDLFYKSLRSGINLKGKNGTTEFYFKSLLFLYFKSKDIQWDKKSIKQRFFNSQLKQQIQDHNNTDILTFSSNERKLVKDLLGLSTNERWEKEYSKTVTKANDDIDRFKSPIIFKPIRISDTQFKVYLYAESINPGFLNKAFNIKVGSSETLSLFTPSAFSVEDFLQWILNEEHFNIQSHVDSRFYEHHSFNVLDNIYVQLRANQNSTENVG